MQINKNIRDIRLWNILLALIIIMVFVFLLISLNKPGGEFYEAIKTGNIAAVKQIVGANKGLIDERIGAFTPLNHSIRFDQFAISEFLVESGADLQIRNGRHSSPILSLPAILGDIKTIKLLLRHGADVNAKDTFFETPLMKAAQNCHIEVIELLIANGAKIDAKTNSVDGYRTALDYAKERGCSEKIIELLRETP